MDSAGAIGLSVCTELADMIGGSRTAGEWRPATNKDIPQLMCAFDKAVFNNYPKMPETILGKIIFTIKKAWHTSFRPSLFPTDYVGGLMVGLTEKKTVELYVLRELVCDHGYYHTQLPWRPAKIGDIPQIMAAIKTLTFCK